MYWFFIVDFVELVDYMYSGDLWGALKLNF